MNKSVVISAKAILVALLVIVLAVSGYCVTPKKIVSKNPLAGKTFVQQFSEDEDVYRYSVYTFVDNGTGFVREVSSSNDMTKFPFNYVLSGNTLTMTSMMSGVTGKVQWLTKDKFKYTYDGKTEFYARQGSADDMTSGE